MFRRWILGLAAAIAVSSAVAASDGRPIRLGAFLALTGEAAFLGDPEAKTLRLYVDRLNRAGGVAGRRLKLTIYDTTSSPTLAVDQIRRLIEFDQVDVLIGGSTTADTMAALPIVEARRLPLISLAAGFTTMDTTRRWVFAVPHSDRMAVHRIFDDLQARGLHRIALIGGFGYYDATCRGAVHDFAVEHAISIVADEAYGRFAAPDDVIPQLKRIKATPDVQAVIGCGFGEASVMVVRNYRELGLSAIPLYFTQGIGSQRFLDAAGDAAEGLRLPLSAVMVADQLRVDDPQVALALNYRAAYADAFGEPVSSFGGHAYDALMLLADAIRRAGTGDRAAIRDALEHTEALVGVGGIFTLTPTDHRGLTKKTLTMVEVRHGGWRLLATPP